MPIRSNIAPYFISSGPSMQVRSRQAVGHRSRFVFCTIIPKVSQSGRFKRYLNAGGRREKHPVRHRPTLALSIMCYNIIQYHDFSCDHYSIVRRQTVRLLVGMSTKVLNLCRLTATTGTADSVACTRRRRMTVNRRARKRE